MRLVWWAGSRNLAGSLQAAGLDDVSNDRLRLAMTPALCVGASGGSRIVTATQQVAMNVLLHGAPRRRRGRRPTNSSPRDPLTCLRVETIAPLDPMQLHRSAGRSARLSPIQPIHNVANVQAIRDRSQPIGPNACARRVILAKAAAQPGASERSARYSFTSAAFFAYCSRVELATRYPSINSARGRARPRRFRAVT